MYKRGQRDEERQREEERRKNLVRRNWIIAIVSLALAILFYTMNDTVSNFLAR